jgi:NADPH:quinone reductase-like Zn-dependent oxidoreductase
MAFRDRYAMEDKQLSHARVRDEKGSFGRSRTPDRSKYTYAESRDDLSSHFAASDTWFQSVPTIDESEEDVESKASSTEGKISQRRVLYTSFGETPSKIMYIEKSDKLPKIKSPTDVLVRVEASTVSLHDSCLRRGLDMEVSNPVSLPGTPGADIVGTIQDCGDFQRLENEYGLQQGTRVAALIRHGGNARYVVVPSSSLVKVPRSVKAADAACMVSPFMAAYQAMQLATGKAYFSLQGKKILVIGGAGPIGQAIIQMAHRARASLIFATAPLGCHKYVKKNLKSTPIPMESEEWLPLIRGKMDVVFDSACADGTYDTSRAALSDRGTLVCVGLYGYLERQQRGMFGAPLSAHWARIKSEHFMSNTVVSNLWKSFKHDPEKYKKDLLFLFELLKRNEIKPTIAKRVALCQVGNAQTYLEKGKNLGSIVCMPWKKPPVAGAEGSLEKRESSIGHY